MRSPLVPLIGSLLWFAIAPGSIAILFPWLFSGWEVRPAFLGLDASRWLGWALIFLGGLPLIEAFTRFAVDGRGTPAPYMLTERLVVTGSYRHVRNPMYVAILSIVLGEALILGQGALIAYAMAVWVIFQLFVLFYEEPSLKRRYGRQYEVYCTGVRRWWPGLKPWAGDATGQGHAR